MKNKLDKEYFLELYKTYEEDNMVYALTILKSLGLKEWFLKNNDIFNYHNKEIAMIIKNIEFVNFFNLDKFVNYQTLAFMLRIDNATSYFNQDQLDKLDNYEIKQILIQKPELKKYLINCTNYEKQITLI